VAGPAGIPPPAGSLGLFFARGAHVKLLLVRRKQTDPRQALTFPVFQFDTPLGALSLGPIIREQENAVFTALK
jgi:hypothetical protein